MLSIIHIYQIVSANHVIEKVDGYEISIRVWRCLGNMGVIWSTALFNKILRTKKIFDEWRVP